MPSNMTAGLRFEDADVAAGRQCRDYSSFSLDAVAAMASKIHRRANTVQARRGPPAKVYKRTRVPNTKAALCVLYRRHREVDHLQKYMLCIADTTK